MRDFINYSKYLVIPWVRGGRDFNGVDCFGLCKLIRDEVNKKTPDYFYENPTPEEVGRLMLQHQQEFRRLDKPEPFCFVTFWDEVKEFSSHVGIVLEDCRRFIHIRNVGNKRPTIEKLNVPVWLRRRTGYWEPL